mgnify:CR=1 FL=1
MLSAVLTIGRESIAGYCLYGDSQLKAAEYIYENSEPEDTVLTDMRHNNEIAALTGRNIVCGSTSYVYFTGSITPSAKRTCKVCSPHRRQTVRSLKNTALITFWSPLTSAINFTVNEAEIKALFPCVFDENGVQIYKSDILIERISLCKDFPIYPPFEPSWKERLQLFQSARSELLINPSVCPRMAEMSGAADCAGAH